MHQGDWDDGLGITIAVHGQAPGTHVQRFGRSTIRLMTIGTTNTTTTAPLGGRYVRDNVAELHARWEMARHAPRFGVCS